MLNLLVDYKYLMLFSITFVFFRFLLFLIFDYIGTNSFAFVSILDDLVFICRIIFVVFLCVSMLICMTVI